MILTNVLARGSAPGGNHWLMALIGSSPMLVIGMGFAKWGTSRKRAWRERAHAADFCLCPDCGYDVRSIAMPKGVARPDIIRCPECGTEIEMHDARRMWRLYVGRRPRWWQ